jgi:hypothetical protein
VRLFDNDDHCVVDLAGWVASLDAVVELIAGRFGRVEPRRRVGAYLRGLLIGLERKNGWTLAEYAGAVCPGGDAAVVYDTRSLELSGKLDMEVRLMPEG